jgi:hypothetical protein
MLEDVRLAVEGQCPVEFYGRMGGVMPLPDEILEELHRTSVTYSARKDAGSSPAGHLAGDRGVSVGHPLEDPRMGAQAPFVTVGGLEGRREREGCES